MQKLGPVQNLVHTTQSLTAESLYCKICNGEFTKLLETQICLDCSMKLDEQATRERARATAVKLMFPPRAWNDFTFENYKENSENKHALEKCKKFDPKTDNFYIFGNVGSGKSHLAYATARAHVKSHKLGIFKQPEIFRMFRRKNEIEERELLKKFTDYEILIIDDMGVSKSTEFSTQILYEIIDSRYMNCKNGLIITSNLTMDEISHKMDESRISDRIMEMCTIIRLNCDVSWRIKKHNFSRNKFMVTT